MLVLIVLRIFHIKIKERSWPNLLNEVGPSKICKTQKFFLKTDESALFSCTHLTCVNAMHFLGLFLKVFHFTLTGPTGFKGQIRHIKRKKTGYSKCSNASWNNKKVFKCQGGQLFGKLGSFFPISFRCVHTINCSF